MREPINIADEEGHVMLFDVRDERTLDVPHLL